MITALGLSRAWDFLFTRRRFRRPWSYAYAATVLARTAVAKLKCLSGPVREQESGIGRWVMWKHEYDPDQTGPLDKLTLDGSWELKRSGGLVKWTTTANLSRYKKPNLQRM